MEGTGRSETGNQLVMAKDKRQRDLLMNGIILRQRIEFFLPIKDAFPLIDCDNLQDSAIASNTPFDYQRLVFVHSVQSGAPCNGAHEGRLGVQDDRAKDRGQLRPPCDFGKLFVPSLVFIFFKRVGDPMCGLL